MKAEKEMFVVINDEDADTMNEALKEKIRIKYDIPATVYLFGWESEFGNQSSSATMAFMRPHIAAFVKGGYTEDTWIDFLFYVDECVEFDYGWVLAELPFGFYRAGGSKIDCDAVSAQLESIATRSKKKARNLPRVTLKRSDDDS